DDHGLGAALAHSRQPGTPTFSPDDPPSNAPSWGLLASPAPLPGTRPALWRAVTVPELRVASVEEGIEPRRYLPGASVRRHRSRSIQDCFGRSDRRAIWCHHGRLGRIS